MRFKLPALAHVVVERLHNRRITLRRYEAGGGYYLILQNCLSRQDAAEHIATKAADDMPSELVRGRILVTHLKLSNEALGMISRLHQQHEQSATTRQKERSRRQQMIVSRLAALEEAVLNDELHAPVPPVSPAPAAAKPVHKSRK
ncbi:hypothetical protein GCM10028824_36660 [Hymenobacter segetis]|uniref:Uncharacterized protein n=1 Tax=Hymenobacter segetis TaxID=2025509 RepID=A0ABU9LX31_9BACT